MRHGRHQRKALCGPPPPSVICKKSPNRVEILELQQALRLDHLGSVPIVDRPQPGHPRVAIEHIEQLVEHWSRLVEGKVGAPATSTKASTQCKGGRCPWGANTEASSVTPAVIPFGSYALGARGVASDLDLLVLAPPSIHRGDFFTELVRVLEDDSRCQHVQPISSAYTPVIKFVYVIVEENGKSTMLPIDLVFAKVANTAKLVAYHRQKNSERVALYTLDDTDIDGLDEEGIRSLNGARVSQIILRSVPDVAKFRDVLCTIKHWAQLRGIYSNALGFLGGVSWAIMVAYVCQTSRIEASTAEVVRSFFALFSKWDWTYPVVLNGHIAHVPPVTNVSLQTRAIDITAWNPVDNPKDGQHLMQIITPAYPSMNSSFNVKMAQLRRIQSELQRMAVCLQYQRQRGIGLQHLLSSPTNFFNLNRDFVQVTISADSAETFVPWFRWVETKLRCLICNLETEHIETRPFSRFFDSPHNPFEKRFYVALRFKNEDACASADESIQALQMDFLHQVNQWTNRKPDMSITISTTTEVPNVTTATDRCVIDKDERSTVSETTAPPTDDEEDDSVGSAASCFVRKI